MRQIIYISAATGSADALSSASILAVSRRNNVASGVTGVLYFDGTYFIQALEGITARVRDTFARIERDARHGRIIMLSDRPILQREFGDWAMAYPRSDEDGPTGAIARLRRAAAEASPAARASFGRCPGLRAEFAPA